MSDECTDFGVALCWNLYMYCRCRLVFLHEQSEQDCIEDKEFYGQHLGRFCLDYYDEGEILLRILYPVY